jgi:hypothetical protein
LQQRLGCALDGRARAGAHAAPTKKGPHCPAPRLLVGAGQCGAQGAGRGV